MARKIVTLEIDTTIIRLMETRGEKVTKWASLVLEPTTVEEGEVVLDPVALSTAIKQLMASSGIEGKEVITSVRGLYSVNRILTVPTPAGRAPTSQAVLDAAEEVMPLAREQLYLSWQTIATGEGVQQVLAVGIPRDVLDTELQALKMAGIHPHLLELKAMALARAVNREQALILNIEPSSFDIIMIVNGIPEVIRTTAWQQNELTLEDKAEHLGLSLELTVDFYNTNHPDTPLDPATPLIITGQMSGEPTLIEKLEARLGYSINLLTPPLDCPSHLPVSQYAVNIGLTMKGMPPVKAQEQNGYSPPNINLLPQTYQPWKPSARQIYFFLGILAAVALLFPLYQLASGAMAETADLKAQYAAINTKLQLKQVEIKNREPLHKAINEYNTILAMGGSFTDDLTAINSEAAKVGIQVQSISHEGETITVTCQADSPAAFDDYLTGLEETGRFTTPIPPPEGYPYTTGGIIKLKPKPSQ